MVKPIPGYYGKMVFVSSRLILLTSEPDAPIVKVYLSFMEKYMHPLVYLLYMILNLYSLVLLVWIVLSWLIAFNVVNSHNRFVSTVGHFLERLVEPVLRHVRRYIPPVGGMDLSPIVVFIAINFIQYTLMYYF